MTLFEQKVNFIRPLFMKDFDASALDAAAVIGNFAHETGGFKHFQELNPTVAGSRGGFGWPQWTGPRRRAYEAYCKRNNLDPFSDKANYAYVFVELKGTEKNAIKKLKEAKGLKAKVTAFEKAYERAGIKHYAKRYEWAKKAKAVPLTAITVEKPERKEPKMNSLFGFIGNLVSGFFAPRSKGGATSWLGRIFGGGAGVEAAGGNLTFNGMEVLGDNLIGQPWYIMLGYAVLWAFSEKQDMDTNEPESE